MSGQNESKRSAVLIYLAACCLSVVLLILALQLWRANLFVPFNYSVGGDSLLYPALVKGVIENGWWTEIHSLGAPGILQMYDFPQSHTTQLLIIKFLSLFSGNYALVLNLFYLLGYPLTTLTSLFVFRRFQVSFPAAILGSLLFTFIPYHLMRGEGHLFLTCYFHIPLMVMVVLWCFQGEEASFEFVLAKNPKIVWGLLICVLVGLSGLYYAFFGHFPVCRRSSLFFKERKARSSFSPCVLRDHCLRPLGQLFPQLRFRDQARAECFGRSAAAV